jgi:nodulation protein E
MRRVAITGAGTVNPLGADVAATFAAFKAGSCAIGPLDIPGADRLLSPLGAQVRSWDADLYFDRKSLVLYDRHVQFALVAARQAVAQAGLDLPGSTLAARSGVIIGTAGGGLTTIDDTYREVYAGGKNRVHPFTVPRLMASSAPSHIGMEHGLLGPTFAVSTACASSNHAMGLAFQMVRAGAAPLILTGGAEAMLCFGGIKAWEGLRVMTADAVRPFSKDRSGMAQGEGAGIFVFEDMDHARARGAVVLAEVIGFAMTADAHNIVVPSQAGAIRAMTGALSDAGITAAEVDYINAHGTGTQVNDRVESAAIHAVFGGHADRLAVSSTKAMHGHLIGGTGAVEVLACLMALIEGVIAPTAGFRVADPDCALDVVPNQARRANVSVAMSNAFAFGGLNAVLALRAP